MKQLSRIRRICEFAIFSADQHINEQPVLLYRASSPTKDVLHVLDTRLQALALTRTAVDRLLKNHVSRIHHDRNSVSLIHKLPTELLVHIIQLSIVSSTHNFDKSRYEKLQILSRVSSAWHAVIVDTPPLWSIIEDSDGAMVNSISLQRSAQHPLVVISKEAGPPASSSVFRPSFLAQAGRHIYRWASLKINASSSASFDCEELTSPAPILERLTVVVSEGPASDKAPDLFSGDAPRLLHVNLEGLGLRNWDTPILSRLKSLRLAGRSYPAPSLKQVLAILSNSPLLEKLELKSILSITQAETAPDATSSPILLQHLADLRLRELSAPILEALLTNIRAPVCSRTRLYCSYSYGDEPTSFTLGQALQTFLPENITPILLLSGDITLRLGVKTCTLSASSATGVFELGLGKVTSTRPLQWIADTLKEVVKSKGIEIFLETGFDIADEEVTSILWTLCSLTKLNVAPHISNVNILLDTLSRPEWIFPKLRTLRIEADAFDEFAALRMVETRYGRRFSTAPDVTPALPQPFEMLVFRNIENNVWAQVKSIVGQDRIRRLCPLLPGGRALHVVYDDYVHEEADSDVDEHVSFWEYSSCHWLKSFSLGLPVLIRMRSRCSPPQPTFTNHKIHIFIHSRSHLHSFVFS